MGEHTETKFATEAVEYVERLVPHDEEQNPVPPDPCPGMLVGRVTERLAGASLAIHEYYQAEAEDERAKLLEIAVCFIGAATIATNAIPHIHPYGDDAEPTVFKNAFVRKLDERTAEIVNGGTFYDDACPEDWLRRALSLITGACQSTQAYEDELTLPAGGREWADEEDEHEGLSDPEYELEPGDVSECDYAKVDQLRAAIADSLYDVAVMAAAAGEWFISQHIASGQDPDDDELDDDELEGLPADITADWSDELQHLFDPGDLGDWDEDQRWSYRDAPTSVSRRYRNGPTIAILGEPNAFARRLTTQDHRSG